jgi:hypothetical protein
MSALGHERTFRSAIAMPAIPPKVDASRLESSTLSATGAGRSSRTRRERALPDRTEHWSEGGDDSALNHPKKVEHCLRYEQLINN